MNKQIAIRQERPRPPDFRLLGALEITVGGLPRELGPDREQRLLAALLSAGGMPVSHERLMQAIWDDQPEGALDDLYHLVSHLRKRLAAAGLEDTLIAVGGAYRLDIPAAYVDVHRFHDLIGHARELAGDDDRQAVALIEEALRLYRGEPLTGLHVHGHS